MLIPLTIYVLFDIISRFVLFDVIFSWFNLFWIRIRPKFLSNIMDPLYLRIKKIFPTTIWFFDLTPIILIFVLMFLKWLLIFIFPSLTQVLSNINFF